MKSIKVTCAIITIKNKILAVQRSRVMSLPMKWEFPGGKIEPGESPEECVVRECREELEIDIEVRDLFEQMTYSYPEREFEFLFFRASMTDGVPLASVHNCIKWVSPDMLEKYKFCPADVFVVEKLSKGK